MTFTGRVPDAELLAMLNTADVCVNPDVANEMNDKSTMNKIMEYMALGKPIVQFDLTEGRFSAQEASLYASKNDPVDLAAKIVELLDDPAARGDGRVRPPARGRASSSGATRCRSCSPPTTRSGPSPRHASSPRPEPPLPLRYVPLDAVTMGVVALVSGRYAELHIQSTVLMRADVGISAGGFVTRFARQPDVVDVFREVRQMDAVAAPGTAGVELKEAGMPVRGRRHPGRAMP